MKAPAPDIATAVLSPAERAFYRRQMTLPTVGEGGQLRLRSARVLVVGAGGLGCPALLYLAAAGVGHLTVCDGDPVEASNLHRQVAYAYADIGRPKAAAIAERLRAQNPFVGVESVAYPLVPGDALERIRGHDLVLDCTDNFAAKFLLHDACWLLDVPLVQASIYQFDGQLTVYRRAAAAGCLRCLFPEQPEEGCTGTCADVGVLGVVPGVLGALQAAEALSLLLAGTCAAERATLFFDLRSGRSTQVARPRNPHCPLCGETPVLCGIDPARYAAEPAWTLDLAALGDRLEERYTIVDVRSPDEHAAGPDQVRALRNVPAREIDALAALTTDMPLLLVCARGVRSRQAADELRRRGRTDVYSLRQGVDALPARNVCVARATVSS